MPRISADSLVPGRYYVITDLIIKTATCFRFLGNAPGGRLSLEGRLPWHGSHEIIPGYCTFYEVGDRDIPITTADFNRDRASVGFHPNNDIPVRLRDAYTAAIAAGETVPPDQSPPHDLVVRYQAAAVAEAARVGGAGGAAAGGGGGGAAAAAGGAGGGGAGAAGALYDGFPPVGDPKVYSAEDIRATECSICLEPLKENIVAVDTKGNAAGTKASPIKCGHKFHRDCAEAIQKSAFGSIRHCPLCRGKILRFWNAFPSVEGGGAAAGGAGGGGSLTVNTSTRHNGSLSNMNNLFGSGSGKRTRQTNRRRRNRRTRRRH